MKSQASSYCPPFNQCLTLQHLIYCILVLIELLQPHTRKTARWLWRYCRLWCVIFESKDIKKTTKVVQGLASMGSGCKWICCGCTTLKLLPALLELWEQDENTLQVKFKLCLPLMSLVSWYDSIPFYFCILVFPLWCWLTIMHGTDVTPHAITCAQCLIFVKSILLATPLFSNAQKRVKWPLAWPVLKAGWTNAHRALRNICLIHFTF